MADRIGQRFGDYRLTRFLGQGTFGEVYLGQHVHDQTLAAVKVIKTNLGDDIDLKEVVKKLREFINEASTFNLKHPHIAQLLAFGIGKDDTPFLVITYAPNGSLRTRHPKGTCLPLDTIVIYTDQIAGTLQYAHDHKRIHRDVKPENILLGPNDDILLSDFGIATFAHSTESWEEQKRSGTPVYMAPEQIQQQARPASDQYALGVMVYEWLCGTPPFRGDYVQLIYQHLQDPPPPLREKVPTISPDVERVVMTALAKDSHQRFGSVQAFANALEQSSQPAFVPPPPVSPPPLAPTQYAGSSPPQEAQPTSSIPAAEQKSVIPPSLPSTQAVPISSLPPTQYVGGPSLQEVKLSSSDNIPAEVRPITSPSGGKTGTTESKSQKVHLWRIGKRQIVAALIGFAIIACLSIPIGFSVSYPYTISPIIGFLCLSLVLIAPEFFGAVFGPWVGLFTGIGLLVGYIIDNNTNRDFHFALPISVFLPILLGVSAVCFISGFALFKQHSREKKTCSHNAIVWRRGCGRAIG